MCHHLSGMVAALARDGAEGYVGSPARHGPDTGPTTDTTTPSADTAPTSTGSAGSTAQATTTEGDRR